MISCLFLFKIFLLNRFYNDIIPKSWSSQTLLCINCYPEASTVEEKYRSQSKKRKLLVIEMLTLFAYALISFKDVLNLII